MANVTSRRATGRNAVDYLMPFLSAFITCIVDLQAIDA